MRILYVCNYPSWERVSAEDQASHHLFGIYQKIDKWEVDGRKYRAVLKEDLGYVDFQLCTSMRDQIKIWFKSFSYDIVYDVLNCTKQISALIYYMSPSRLVSILHHPPFDKQMKFGCSDAYVFFSQKHKSLALSLKPSSENQMFVNEWQPDISWYKKHLDVRRRGEKYTIVDNGRTNRDHEFLIDAIKEARVNAFIFDKDLKGEENVYEVPDCYYKELDVMAILQNCKCIAIPLRPNSTPYGPIAATVLMDAMALQKPVICSDNFYLADQVNKYQIGLLYKAGDKSSLVDCLKRVSDDKSLVDRLSVNMKAYSERSSLQEYSDKVFYIFKALLS